MHLALFRLVSLTNSTECSRVSFFHHTANFRVRFFPVLRSALNSQGETEGRRDILSQEGKCLLVPVMQANLQSPVLGPEGGQRGEKVLTNSQGGRTSWNQQGRQPPARSPLFLSGHRALLLTPAPPKALSQGRAGPRSCVLRQVTASHSTCRILPCSSSHTLEFPASLHNLPSVILIYLKVKKITLSLIAPQAEHPCATAHFPYDDGSCRDCGGWQRSQEDL